MAHVLASLPQRLLNFWSAPRPVGAPPIGWLDWMIVATSLGICAAEVAVKPELGLATPIVWISAAILCLLPWRRRHPLLVTVLTFGSVSIFDVVRFGMGLPVFGPDALAFLLMVPYALYRWGSGREAELGLLIMLVAASCGLLDQEPRLGDLVGGYAILLASVALGLAFRFGAEAHDQELEQARSMERQHIARDLHDTVAHHVSAITIRAQAGLAMAEHDPDAAADALRVIASEAARTLGEMRAMVGVLRAGEAADMAPTPGIDDLDALRAKSLDGPAVHIDVRGDVDALPKAVSAAVYRMAQESITNARRHAREATRIDVAVLADAHEVCLRVRDDGTRPARQRRNTGFGLVGMAERASLLGGEFDAGPGERGWQVTAVLPRGGPS